MFNVFVGHRGLVGLFVNKFIRCQGSRDRIPVVPLFRERTSSKLERRNVGRKEQVIHPHEKKGGSGDLKRKDRQAFQDWIREVVRFVSKTIKWWTPSKD